MPDGEVAFHNPEKLMIFRLKHHQLSSLNGTEDEESLVQDPVHTNLEYRFNRFGQHVATLNRETGRTIYEFAYSKNTAFGKLSRVSDGLGNKLHFKRDYTNRVQNIEDILGHKFGVRLSLMGHLEGLETAPSGAGEEVRLSYQVWTLAHFCFLFPLCRKSLICLDPS